MIQLISQKLRNIFSCFWFPHFTYQDNDTSAEFLFNPQIKIQPYILSLGAEQQNLKFRILEILFPNLIASNY